jgi:hypothetical protein
MKHTETLVESKTAKNHNPFFRQERPWKSKRLDQRSSHTTAEGEHHSASAPSTCGQVNQTIYDFSSPNLSIGRTVCICLVVQAGII